MAEGRVLIVDDEEDIRKTVKLILNKANFDVIEAADGGEGIQTIQSGDNPLALDTIICDLDMPNVHGTEAIAYFRSQFPSVPIIVLTGNPEIHGANELFKQGIAEYLTKPIDPEQLVQSVRKATNSHELFKDQFAT